MEQGGGMGGGGSEIIFNKGYTPDRDCVGRRGQEHCLGSGYLSTDRSCQTKEIPKRCNISLGE